MPTYALVDVTDDGQVESLCNFKVKARKTMEGKTPQDIAKLTGFGESENQKGFRLITLPDRPLDLDGIIAQRQQSE